MTIPTSRTLRADAQLNHDRILEAAAHAFARHGADTSLKAIAMNFVSIAGSFGALVWIFQDGHLFVRDGRPLEPSVPVLLFCVIFGLSMDYEVLMLSRIKEAYDRTGDNTQAVAEGLTKTAGLITSSAAIMVAVAV